MVICPLSGQTEFFSMRVERDGCAPLVTGSSGANAKALAPRRVTAKAAMAVRFNITSSNRIEWRSLERNIAAGSAIEPERSVHLPFISPALTGSAARASFAVIPYRRGVSRCMVRASDNPERPPP
jgi:hypothetical protein